MAKKLFPDGTEVAAFYVRTIKSGPFVFVSGTTSLNPRGRCRARMRPSRRPSPCARSRPG